MAVAVAKTEAESGLISQFEALENTLPGADWVKNLRREAIALLDKEGLPTRRNEPFKYTDLRSMMRTVETFVTAGETPVSETDIYDVLGVDLDELDAYRVVVIDGEFSSELSHFDRASGVEVMSMKAALEDAPAWFEAEFNKVNPPEIPNVQIAINTAFMTDGAVIHIKDGTKLDKPIHLICITGSKTPIALANRNFIKIGKNAEATILETYAYRRLPASQRHTVTEVTVADGARFQHIKYQNEGVDAVHLSTVMSRIGKDAEYRSFQFALGGHLVRNQIYARFKGENAKADISGTMMLFGRQHCDITMLVDHEAAHCESRELFKTVLDDQSRGVFQGKLKVHKGAQKTDAKEMVRALLLAETAAFDAKPELEIYADDVACGHGATSGQIDDDLLFYLRARGIPEELAKTMLITAFIGEVLGQIENDQIREAMERISCGWLGCTW